MKTLPVIRFMFACHCVWLGVYVYLFGRQVCRLTFDPTNERGPTLGFAFKPFGGQRLCVCSPLARFIEFRFRLPWFLSYAFVTRHSGPLLLVLYRCQQRTLQRMSGWSRTASVAALLVAMLWCQSTEASDLTLIDFGGWTAMDLQVCRSWSGVATDIKTTPTPPSERIGILVNNMQSASGGVVRHFCSESYTHTSGSFSVFGFYVYIDGLDPNPEYELLRATEVGSETTKSAYHWYAKIESDDGNIDVYDANDSLIGEVLFTFVSSTWYLIEIAWTKSDTAGRIDWYVDGSLTNTWTSQDTKNGTGTAQTFCVGGQGGFATVISTPSVLSWYLLDDGIPDSRYGAHDVVGPYTTDHTGATNECGGTDLKFGHQWNEMITMPFGNPFAELVSGTTGRQTNGSSLFGPIGDSRIVDYADVRGLKCTARLLGGDSYFQCGSFNGFDTPKCTIVEDPDGGGGVQRIVMQTGDAAMPEEDEYITMGWRTEGGATRCRTLHSELIVEESLAVGGHDPNPSRATMRGMFP